MFEYCFWVTTLLLAICPLNHTNISKHVPFSHSRTCISLYELRPFLARRQEVALISIEVVDQHGNLVPTASNVITVTGLAGAGAVGMSGRGPPRVRGILVTWVWFEWKATSLELRQDLNMEREHKVLTS